MLGARQKASDAGIAGRFADNRNGTVTDDDMGLHWEKRTSPGGDTSDPHDVDTYVWTALHRRFEG